MRWSLFVAAALLSLAAASPEHPSSAAPVEKTLTCDELNGFDKAPPSGWRVILGRVALPPERWFRSRPRYGRDYLPFPYFAKAGLEVHAQRAPFDLVVPAGWRGRLALGWGEDHTPRFASVIHVPRCAPVLGRAWLWWAGGYFLRRPACVPVIVRSGARTTEVRLAIGRPCS
jgi:hypothetical protein